MRSTYFSAASSKVFYRDISFMVILELLFDSYSVILFSKRASKYICSTSRISTYLTSIICLIPFLFIGDLIQGTSFSISLQILENWLQYQKKLIKSKFITKFKPEKRPSCNSFISLGDNTFQCQRSTDCSYFTSIFPTLSTFSSEYKLFAMVSISISPHKRELSSNAWNSWMYYVSNMKNFPMNPPLNNISVDQVFQRQLTSIFQKLTNR